MRSFLYYVAHPYGGLCENREKVQQIIQELSSKIEFADATFVSPIHQFGFTYETVSYVNGVKKCLSLLAHCDALLLTGDWKNSRRCMAEYAFAKASGIEIFDYNRRSRFGSFESVN